MQTEIGPRREAIFACDAGLRIMQAKPQRRYFFGSTMCDGGQVVGKTRDRGRVAVAIKSQQCLRLFLQMVEIGPGGQRLHSRPPCISLPKVRSTGSTKAD
jgi:hypothetical protein